MNRILVVDDDDPFRFFFCEFLRREGYEVLEASDGQGALNVLKSSPPGRFPDMIITDLQMGPIDGYELMRRVRSDEKTRKIPIVMLTGTSGNFREIAEQEGAKYMTKLSPLVDILSAVKKILPDSTGRHALGAQVSFIPPYSTRPGNPRDFTASFSPPNGQTAPLAPERRVENAKPPMAPPRPAPRSADYVPLKEELHLQENLRRLTDTSTDLKRLVEKAEKESEEDRASNNATSDSSPMAQLADKIIREAIAAGASDVHVEPKEAELTIRFRVDGDLHTVYRLPAHFRPLFPARIKVMASMNISEHRLPQDGHLSLILQDGKRLNFRVSTLPSSWGEKVVIRILGSKAVTTTLEDIFPSPRDLDCVKEALKSPIGLILLTGPTGGGKTTTLYSMLKILNTPDRNIITVEDPIEYELPGTTQVLVRPDIDYTFAKVLRACMRQDPNVMMVGEIRDEETADIAVRAAMTGHLVLSTLHTNYAAMAPARLVQMGVKPYLIAGALRLVVAQRLVRILCPKCKEKSVITKEEASHLGKEEADKLGQGFIPKGCDECKGYGYKGRKTLAEVVSGRNPELRRKIGEGVPSQEIERLAIGDGMIPLKRSALDMAARGLISISDAIKVYLLD